MDDLPQPGQITALQEIDHPVHLAGKPVDKFRDDLHHPRIAGQAALDAVGTGDGGRSRWSGDVGAVTVVGHG